jgi:hypothetical protein
MTEDIDFYRWIDGELSGEASAAMEARVAADPALARLAAQHRALNAGLRGAFDPVASAPIPERLSRLLEPSNVVDFKAARERRGSARSWTMQAAALAASLAIGFVVGNRSEAGGDAAISRSGGQMVASNELAKALDVRLASAPAAGEPRIGLTYRNAAGQWCRSFTDAGSSGLACRKGETWQIRGLFGSGEGQGAQYRMAAGADPRLMEMVDEGMKGEPLDPQEEEAAVRSGWR